MMKRDRPEHARELFLSGHNCAQSVVLSFAEDLKFSKELAQKISAGFGGGMGRQQETCGAVTGSVMILGMIHGERVSSNDELKSKTYASVAELFREFSTQFDTTRCKDLVGCDLTTQEGSQQFKDQGIQEKICADCVEKAVKIVESLMSK